MAPPAPLISALNAVDDLLRCCDWFLHHPNDAQQSRNTAYRHRPHPTLQRTNCGVNSGLHPVNKGDPFGRRMPIAGKIWNKEGLTSL